MSNEKLQAALNMPQFPKSSKYDAEWICKNEMGPCSLWLCEFLTEKMELKPGMRVLDMGCGKGMSSIFLAKEYGVTVFANDLWISATDNFKRFEDAGLQDKIFPFHAEAHALPYADEFFDAIVSLDSYHYYGTDALYLDYIAKFLKPGGSIGIVYPGLKKEFDDSGIPDYIMPHWDASMYSFHTPEWWKRLWQFSSNIKVEVSDLLPNGFEMWQYWENTLEASGLMARSSNDNNLLRADNGRYLTFGRTIGRKTEKRW
jgi:cyclopropane fatty-acyl-phospholipid synthase-like methyltransferase